MSGNGDLIMNAVLKISRYSAVILLIVFISLGGLWLAARLFDPIGDGLRNVVRGTFVDSLTARLIPEDEHDHQNKEESEHEHELESAPGHDHHSESEHKEETGDPKEAHHKKEEIVQLILNPVSMKNFGLDNSAIQTVRVTEYKKSRLYPAIIEDRPGHSLITVPSPAAGIVTKIFYEQETSVDPGSPIFEIELNREMVREQTEYLALIKEREINAAEIERLKPIETATLPKVKRDLEYDRERIEQNIKSKRKMLLTQGINEEEIVRSLEKEKKTIDRIIIHAPAAATLHREDQTVLEKCPFTLEELSVNLGAGVNIGDPLCRLSDLCRLTVRGMAFASNEAELNRALEQKSGAFLVLDGLDGKREFHRGLNLRSIENKIDLKNGSLNFHLDLDNSFTCSESKGEDHDGISNRRYTQWRYKPGQRCEIGIEYDRIENCIVLPAEAVAPDLSGWCVFEWTKEEGDSRIWKKTPVHLLLKTRDEIVLANDGALRAGSQVAGRGAVLLLNALNAKNQAGSGGGVVHGDHVH